MTEIYVGFIDNKTKKEYENTKNKDPELFKLLERATDDLKKNPGIGIKIPRHLWPKEYLKKYKIDNLWKYDLPNAWRLIYTIAKDEIKIMAIILEWMDHKNYERRFNF